MAGILREDELQLPRGVTTATGKYTAGTPITSRSAPRAAVTNTRIDLPVPDFVKPAPRSTGRYTQSNVNASRTPLVAPPIASSQPGVSIIPAAEARSVRAAGTPSTTPVDMMAESALGQSNLQAPPVASLPRVGETKNVYGIDGINRYDDASGVPTFTNKGREGYAEIQGMADTPPALPGARALAVTRGPGAETPGGPPALPAARAAGPAAPRASGGGGTFSVVPGLFSGVSRETEQALSQARADASARGDHAAVERSYQTPAERTAADAAVAESRILKRLPRLPAAQQPAALTALTASQTARKGKPLSLDQYRAQQAPQLLAGEEPTAGQNLLFGKSPPAAPQLRVLQNPVTDEEGYATGAKEAFSFDPRTGQTVPLDLAGGRGQGQGAQGGGVPQDGTYDVPGKGRITVRGGRAYDASGAEVL